MTFRFLLLQLFERRRCGVVTVACQFGTGGQVCSSREAITETKQLHIGHLAGVVIVWVAGSARLQGGTQALPSADSVLPAHWRNAQPIFHCHDCSNFSTVTCPYCVQHNPVVLDHTASGTQKLFNWPWEDVVMPL